MELMNSMPMGGAYRRHHFDSSDFFSLMRKRALFSHELFRRTVVRAHDTISNARTIGRERDSEQTFAL
jgi:hypothetical protein